MTTERIRRLLLALALASLGACAFSGGAEPRYHILHPSVQDRATAPIAPTLGLKPVRVPDYLGRTAMVRTEEDGLRISQVERWAEPLDAGIARVLKSNLIESGVTERVEPYPWSARNAPDLVVNVQIATLELRGHDAVMQASVTLERPDRESSGFAKTWRATTDGVEGAAMAAAYSDLINRMTADIVAFLVDGTR